MKICFMGSKQVGIISLLTVLAKGHKIPAVVSYSGDLTAVADVFNIPVYRSINDGKFLKRLSNVDLLLSVQAMEIVRPDQLTLPKFGGINIHPYLCKYKGTHPVRRAFKDGDFKASIGAHVMTDRIDGGKVLIEKRIDASGAKTLIEIYNILYSHYPFIISQVLTKISKKTKGVSEK